MNLRRRTALAGMIAFGLGSGLGLRLASVKLDATIDGDAPKWAQVAEEGEYKGHPAGKFTLNAEVFNEIVENLHNHPSYVANPGKARVIPFDFSHCSEQDPTIGMLPVEGAPAQAWGLDLACRIGADGKAELWCLTEYLEPAKSYVKAGKYQWTSVVIWPNAVDPKTGENLGWYLSSIAFTNDPFIQGMVPIAAAGWRGKNGQKLDTDYEQDVTEDLIRQLRCLFGLNELATVDDIMLALAKLRSYCANPGSEPPGVDSDDLVCGLRWMFNLPTLSSVDEVFAEADKLLATLAEQATSSRMTTNAGGSPKETHVDKNAEAVIALAGRLKVTLKDGEHPGPRLLEAVDQAGQAGNAATDNLKAIMGALGVPDPDAAVAKIAEMFKSVSALEAAMPELKQLRDMKDQSEQKAQEDDVTQAMAYHRFPDSARVALQHMRKTDPANFAKKYPKPSPDQVLLSQSLTTLPQGSTLPAPSAGGGPTPQGGAPLTEAQLSQYEGRNITEKAIAFVRSTDAGKTLSWESANERAAELVRTIRGHSRSSGAANSL